ncbi:ABC transporter substrate-binding protein [Mycobacterium sp. NPDC003449]
MKIASVLAVLMLAVAGCTTASQDESQQAPEGQRTLDGVDVGDVTLRVGIFYDVTRAQTDATDFFKNTPYKVEWARLNGAGPTVQALYGNAIDISWGLSDTATPKGAAEAKEPWTAATAPIKIVGLLKPYEPEKYPGSIIAANTKTGINTLADLRGKSYTYNEGGNANAVALLALHKAGLTTRDVKVQLLQSDSISSAIINGSVDAGSTSITRVGAAIDAGQVKQIASGTEVGFPGYVSITARSGALKDPKLSAAIGDFSERVARFQKWGAENPEEIAKAYVKTQQLTDDQALLAARSSAATLVPVGPDDPGTKDEVALMKGLLDSGFLPHPIDITQYLDNRYSEQITGAVQ